MDLGIEKKVAFVMGASSGLGRAVAEQLMRNGVRIAICGRNSDKLAAACRETGAFGVQGDISDVKSVQEMLDTVSNKLGDIDILVTNTGGPPKAAFSDTSLEMWETAFHNLYLSVVASVQYVLPAMRQKQWGRIIMLTSMAAKEPVKDLSLSNGIRSGLLGLSKTLSTENAPHGITVNMILPGFMKTDRLKNLEIDFDAIGKSIPAQRIGNPSELGALAAFLASTSAGYITGQTITIDGGYTRSIL